MKLLVDNADLDNIQFFAKNYPIDGVTTNPSILLKSGANPYHLLPEIIEILDKNNCHEIHVQVVSTKSQDMVKEAKRIVEHLGKDVYIKVPTVEEGLIAIKELSNEGFMITATAIYSAEQAFLAAKSGASYVAPYVNRIEKFYGGGVETVAKIQKIFKNNGLSTKILSASFKTVEQVMDLAELGVDAATVPADVLKQFLDNNDVFDAVEKFNEDFYSLMGKKTTMYND